MHVRTSLAFALTVLRVAYSLESYASNGQYLFAVVGGDSCAQDLAYGPQTLTEDGTEDSSHQYYLSTSTAGRRVPHNYWMQVVTTDGSNEVFRVYYTWDPNNVQPAMTLTDRIAYAVSAGASVQYHVTNTETGEDAYFFDVIWAFSSTAGINSSTFDVDTTTCCLSGNSGAWGAGGYVSGSDYTSDTPRYSVDENGIPFDFWGVANYQDSDSAESGCSRIYADGASIGSFPNSKTYMYYSVRPFEPAEEPVEPVFTLTIKQSVEGLDYDTYLAMAGDFQYIFMAAVNEAVPLLDSQDVQIPLITEEAPAKTSPALFATHHYTESTGTLQAEYVINHYTDTITAEDANAQLQEAVSSLAFSASLQRLALQYAINEAYNVTSGAVVESTVSSGDDDKKKSGLTSGEIITIVIIAVIVGVALFVGAFWLSSCCCQQSPPERRYAPASSAPAQSTFGGEEAASVEHTHTVVPVATVATAQYVGYSKAPTANVEMQVYSESSRTGNGNEGNASYNEGTSNVGSSAPATGAYAFGEASMIGSGYSMDGGE